jgi:hypothetical protein
MRRLLTTLVVLTAAANAHAEPAPSWTLGPKQLDYREGEPIPPGYHTAERVRKGRVVGGSIMFGAGYFAALIAYGVASKANDHEYWPLVIPAIGPFVTMATANVPIVKGDGAPGVLLLIDGLVQCGGLTLAILGFTDKKTVLLRNDVGLRVTPLIGGGVYALSASLTL